MLRNGGEFSGQSLLSMSQHCSQIFPYLSSGLLRRKRAIILATYSPELYTHTFSFSRKYLVFHLTICALKVAWWKLLCCNAIFYSLINHGHTYYTRVQKFLDTTPSTFQKLAMKEIFENMFLILSLNSEGSFFHDSFKINRYIQSYRLRRNSNKIN